MSSEVRCAKCGSTFYEDQTVYGGSDYCSSCRSDVSSDVGNARNEAYKEYCRTEVDKDEADRKAMAFARSLVNEQAERDRRRRGY